MNLFVSYAREDAAPVESLVARLQDLGEDVWLDRQLTGGQEWWSEVLRNIRRADAIVVALSRASIASAACTSERRYAVDLGKPLLPVQIAHFTPDTLPSDLGRLQVVDYVTPGESTAIRLARAVNALPRHSPLPSPLPPPPDVPYSYLSGLAEQVRTPPSRLEDQLALVSRLETALKSQDLSERLAAAELAGELQGRTDVITAETYQRCERLRPLLEAARTTSTSPGGASTAKGSSSSGGTSGFVKFLAWVGAIVLMLFGLALCSGDDGAGMPCYDYLGNQIAC